MGELSAFDPGLGMLRPLDLLRFRHQLLSRLHVILSGFDAMESEQHLRILRIEPQGVLQVAEGFLGLCIGEPKQTQFAR